MYKKYELTEDEIAFIESTIRVILENENDKEDLLWPESFIFVNLAKSISMTLSLIH